MNKASAKEIDELYRVILQLDSLEDCRRFFRDLLTENEINELTERWKAAKMLAQGVPYSVIAEETGLSSRTIARVGRWLKQGKGGYSMMLTKMGKQ